MAPHVGGMGGGGQKKKFQTFCYLDTSSPLFIFMISPFPLEFNGVLNLHLAHS
jgi:hypothetical protein